MNELIKLAVGFLDNPAMRDKAIAAAEAGFDKWIEPIDLPGPDIVYDPMLRKAVSPIVGAVYDAIIKALKERADA